ncbi:hypothetical protein CSUI_008188 [Cystoisospora suis]|uniref:Uncharacterized protein n=1 Tax=Cystoisospora suis TaxID=483139 RepID=A0A2C6KNE1_9APIC|nr:hypothetical protein CSUI_008188 [Cystoisospora suis]
MAPPSITPSPPVRVRVYPSQAVYFSGDVFRCSIVFETAFSQSPPACPSSSHSLRSISLENVNIQLCGVLTTSPSREHLLSSSRLHTYRHLSLPYTRFAHFYAPEKGKKKLFSKEEHHHDRDEGDTERRGNRGISSSSLQSTYEKDTSLGNSSTRIQDKHPDDEERTRVKDLSSLSLLPTFDCTSFKDSAGALSPDLSLLLHKDPVYSSLFTSTSKLLFLSDPCYLSGNSSSSPPSRQGSSPSEAGGSRLLHSREPGGCRPSLLIFHRHNRHERFFYGFECAFPSFLPPSFHGSSTKISYYVCITGYKRLLFGEEGEGEKKKKSLDGGGSLNDHREKERKNTNDGGTHKRRFDTQTTPHRDEEEEDYYRSRHFGDSRRASSSPPPCSSSSVSLPFVVKIPIRLLGPPSFSSNELMMLQTLGPPILPLSSSFFPFSPSCLSSPSLPSSLLPPPASPSSSTISTQIPLSSFSPPSSSSSLSSTTERGFFFSSSSSHAPSSSSSPRASPSSSTRRFFFPNVLRSYFGGGSTPALNTPPSSPHSSSPPPLLTSASSSSFATTPGSSSSLGLWFSSISKSVTSSTFMYDHLVFSRQNAEGFLSSHPPVYFDFRSRVWKGGTSCGQGVYTVDVATGSDERLLPDHLRLSSSFLAPSFPERSKETCRLQGGEVTKREREMSWMEMTDEERRIACRKGDRQPSYSWYNGRDSQEKEGEEDNDLLSIEKRSSLENTLGLWSCTRGGLKAYNDSYIDVFTSSFSYPWVHSVRNDQDTLAEGDNRFLSSFSPHLASSSSSSSPPSSASTCVYEQPRKDIKRVGEECSTPSFSQNHHEFGSSSSSCQSLSRGGERHNGLSSEGGLKASKNQSGVCTAYVNHEEEAQVSHDEVEKNPSVRFTFQNNEDTKENTSSSFVSDKEGQKPSGLSPRPFPSSFPDDAHDRHTPSSSSLKKGDSCSTYKSPVPPPSSSLPLPPSGGASYPASLIRPAVYISLESSDLNLLSSIIEGDDTPDDISPELFSFTGDSSACCRVRGREQYRISHDGKLICIISLPGVLSFLSSSSSSRDQGDTGGERPGNPSGGMKSQTSQDNKSRGMTTMKPWVILGKSFPVHLNFRPATLCTTYEIHISIVRQEMPLCPPPDIEVSRNPQHARGGDSIPQTFVYSSHHTRSNEGGGYLSSSSSILQDSSSSKTFSSLVPTPTFFSLSGGSHAQHQHHRHTSSPPGQSIQGSHQGHFPFSSFSTYLTPSHPQTSAAIGRGDSEKSRMRKSDNGGAGAIIPQVIWSEQICVSHLEECTLYPCIPLGKNCPPSFKTDTVEVSYSLVFQFLCRPVPEKPTPVSSPHYDGKGSLSTRSSTTLGRGSDSSRTTSTGSGRRAEAQGREERRHKKKTSLIYQPLPGKIPRNEVLGLSWELPLKVSPPLSCRSNPSEKSETSQDVLWLAGSWEAIGDAAGTAACAFREDMIERSIDILSNGKKGLFYIGEKQDEEEEDEYERTKEIDLSEDNGGTPSSSSHPQYVYSSLGNASLMGGEWAASMQKAVCV